MSFKDMIPWRRDRQVVPVQRMDDGRRLAPMAHDDFGLAPFFRETESLFDRFFQDFAGPLFSREGLWGARQGAIGPALQLDMSESDDAFQVSVELPGVDEKDIDVSISRNVLTLRGEKRSETQEDKAGVYRMERSYGRFERSIPLPAEVDEDRIQASFRRGVLEITLPKSPTARERVKKIPVKG